MKVELKDVLHLYLGCQCNYEWINEPNVELTGKVTTSIIDSVYSETELFSGLNQSFDLFLI